MRSLLSDNFDPKDNFTFERLLRQRGFTRIAGTDEAGRGPLAGPVVAASVILPPNDNPALFCDSKQTTALQRSELRDYLERIGAEIGVGIVSSRTIDKINILQASLLAMKESLADLSRAGSEPDFVLVDGNQKLLITTPQETLVKGDARSASIGAASIVAKITRDAIMAEYERRYPGYNFAANKGYTTKEHRLAIRAHGPCPVHRYSFKGVKEFVQETDKPR
ncbi:MAG: ribonuclease HII [Desulfofustis sp.]|nr:ribonuclease HII [Desulfofustis sp.]